ncbi:tyrosine-type recombinase/integrase [Streptomyces sp. NPDC048389]|uniref:tyrosine-type recombinase/integrase n=1 Tax=Streptomyces sp. NPDC048389 TaxID=3154622 RepID=UPI003451FBC9
MAPRASNNPRQIRSKTCGCAPCMEAYPPDQYGERRKRRDCLGSWQARYRDPAGKQKSKNFPKKKDAEDFLDDIRTRVRRRTYNDPKRGEITLAAWWETWWPAQPKRRVTTTNRKLSNWGRHIEPRWGKYRLCDLEYMELQAWLTNDVKGHHTRRKVLELLNAMLRAAVRDGKRIPFNPAAEIELETPPKKHADDLRPPTREQCALIRKHAGIWYRPLLVFLEETGLRWGEATGLRWGNVDLEAKHLKVKEVLSEDKGTLFRQPAPKTAHGFRTVPLTPQALDALDAMAARFQPKRTISAIGSGRDLHPDELVFRGPQGGVLTRHNFRRTWIPAIQAAGLAREVTNSETGRTEWWPRVHDLRHVFATRLKDLGIPEKDAQTILGHDRGSKVTWIYQHSAEDVAADVLAVMAPEKPARAAAVRTLKAV